MSKRVTKKEQEIRVNNAAEGQSFSWIMFHLAEKYSISRRQAKRITSLAYLLKKNDIEGMDLNRHEMTAKLLNTL